MKMDVRQLRTFLEKALGFAFSEFEQLKCVNSYNFRTVRASDGFQFLVKCMPPKFHNEYRRLLQRMEILKGAKVPQRLFAETCPAEFQGYGIVCLSWVEGGQKFPDRLTAKEFDLFLDDYQSLIDDLQKLPREIPPYPIEIWRADVIARCARFGFGLQWLKRLLEGIPIAECTYRDELLKVVHGDLHPGNFYFAGGRISAFFDYEGFLGYPTEDLVRYIVFTYDHVKWYESPWRHRRILACFAHMVGYLPYSEEMWLVAVNENRLERIEKKIAHDNPSVARIFRIWINERFYARLRKIVRSVKSTRQ